MKRELKKKAKAEETLEPAEKVEVLYRYFVYSYEGGMQLRLEEYEVVKETPKGYWILLYPWSDSPRKWVSASSRKRYAYPTSEEALYNYIRRTQRYIRILRGQQAQAENGLRKAKHLIDEGEEIVDLPKGVQKILEELVGRSAKRWQLQG